MADDAALSPTDLADLIEAIDSHIYWQLSDEHYRNDGYVQEPGADEEATVKTIERFKALQDRLELAK